VGKDYKEGVKRTVIGTPGVGSVPGSGGVDINISYHKEGGRYLSCNAFSQAEIDVFFEVASVAAVFVGFGFNRTGGLNLVVKVEGASKTFEAADGTELASLIASLTDWLYDYVKKSLPHRARFLPSAGAKDLPV